MQALVAKIWRAQVLVAVLVIHDVAQAIVLNDRRLGEDGGRIVKLVAR